MKLHAGDTVVVISGKDKGKTGRIMRVLLLEDRVIVAGVNMRTRHLKKTPQTPGRKVQYEASIHASNVALLDSKLKKPTRIGYRLTSDGE
ncbi:MAG: 50S ribosomal protein L24, partial [Patescibacteria group bacterium]